MVFESVVTDVLNKVLGDYVENLDKKQLKIGIWGGDVVLHNLKVKENALDEVDLPVQLVYGFLGKLVLKIPWKNLYSQPVIAQIEDLYMLVAPKQTVQYDAEKEEKYELQVKQAALKALEEAHKKELIKNEAKPDATFSEKLTAQIVNNLQVKISNIHIRYEDASTTGENFALGVTLHDLELYTTDENWEKCYLTQQVSRVFKIANLDSLSAYMNCRTNMYSALSKEELAEVFRKNIAQKDSAPNDYNYVVGPISVMGKLQLNMNPEYDTPAFVIPKIDLALEMQKLRVGLTSTQFQEAIKLGESMNRMQLGVRYRKYRPFNTPYKKHYREWWKFAINCILEEDIKKRNREWTWEHIKEHRQLCNTYAESFREKELSKKPPASLTETCTLLEQKLDLFNLVLIRKRVQIEVDKIRKDEETRQSQKSGWFGGWFGGGQKTEDGESNDIVKKLEAAMTPDEKSKLYDAIGYQEGTPPPDMPVQYEAIKMQFKLLALEVGLYDDSEVVGRESFTLEQLKTLMLLNFSMTTCNLTQRPGGNALSVTVGMHEIKLLGLHQDNVAPVLIESKTTDELNLLDVFFETNPLDKKCDQRIRVSARPLQVVYDADTIIRLAKVFTPPKANLSELEFAATERMANFKERSATGLQYMIDSKSVLEIDIQFMPNIIIVPSNGKYNPNCNDNSLIVITLGKFIVSSKPHNVSSTDLIDMLEDTKVSISSVLERAYDQIQVSIADIQMVVARPGEDWENTLASAVQSDMHILRPTSVLCNVCLCAVDDDPRLPKMKIEIELPSIALNITEDRMFDALRVATSIPLPEGETAQPSSITRAISTASSKLSLASFLTQEKKAKKKAEKVDLSAEIVQYTNLELIFTLKEFTVALNKSVPIKEPHLNEGKTETTESPIDSTAESPQDSNAFGTPVEEMPNDIVLDKIESCTSTTCAVETILSFHVLELGVKMYQRTYEMVVEANLGAVNLKRHGTAESAQYQLNIIDTPRFSKELQYLLTVSYVMAQRTSPEFFTKYNATEQLININFSTLNITLHQEVLLQLLELADSIQRKLDTVLKTSPSADNTPKDRVGNAGDTGILSKLAVIAEEGEEDDVLTALAPAKNRPRQGKVVDSIQVHVKAKLEQVSLLLTCHKRPLASMQVQHFDANVILKSSYTELNLRLKDIVVTDLNPLTKHSGILSIVGDNALECQVIKFNLDETSNYNSDDMRITVSIGGMKIVFLNWFVTGVLSFLNNFQAAQAALAQASAAAADAAKQNAMVAYETASRMKLDIKVKAPVIIVPMDSQSFNAIVLDLGFLSLNNITTEVDVPSDSRRAVLDEIKLELKNMRLAKAAILLDQGRRSSVDTVDMAYGIKSHLNILDPVSCALIVKRNLSSTWYKEVPEMDISGHLKSIEFNLFMEDYAVIMAILNRNLSEGADEFPPVEEPERPQTPKSPDLRAQDSKGDVESATGSSTAKRKVSAVVSATNTPQKSTVHVQMKFSFLFDGVVINLLLNNEEGLARFGLYFLSLKGNKLVNGTLNTSIVLCNIQIDDTRKSNQSPIKKYLCRKDWNESQLHKQTEPTADMIDACKTELNYMLDLTASIKEDDIFAEVRVSSFDLILCVDYLLKLADFFKLPEDTEAVNTIKKPELKSPTTPVTTNIASTSTLKAASSAASAQSTAANNKKMNLILHIEEPDIILVENLDDMNSNAIIFNVQAQLNYRAIGERQNINGQIDSLKMYMCSFMPERREATRHYILHPCMISLHGSTPEEEGLHVSLKLSEIMLNVSPATIELLNKAMRSISADNAQKETNQRLETNYKQLWLEERLQEKRYWFLRADRAVEALEYIESHITTETQRRKTERCVVEVPNITIVIETGIGYYTKPLITVDTRLNAIISDWSDDLKIRGSLTLSTNYYNESLAVWEPIIEMNEHINRNGEQEYLPWELTYKVDIINQKNENDNEEEQDEEEELGKVTQIAIHSDEDLQFTVTKSCLDLLSVLGEAFSQAIQIEGLTKPEVVAPYVVENDTGFDISINFRRGIFTLHECHSPKATVGTNLNSSLVFAAEDADANFSPDQVKDCTISPGGRAYLQTKDLSTITNEEDEEYNLYVQVGGIDKEVVLPVSKSDQRYFPLYRGSNQDPWGIVSEVRSEYGTTKINIHGVVKVHNHFTTTLLIHRYKQGAGREKILVGKVSPGQVFHVPLHAIYADIKELHFSLEGYNMSVQGIKWNDCPTDLDYSRQLQCDPLDTFETFYINVKRVKTEIFHEHSDKYTILSAYYTLHLRPPVYLCNALPISISVSVAGCSVRSAESENVEKSATSAVKEDMLDYGEKEVAPGDVLHLPTVKLSGKSRENRSFLVVRLIQYLEKDWSCTTEISEDHNDMATWRFSSYDSEAKMDMDLCVRFEDRRGALQISLYSPFWMINKTGLMLSYKTDAETVDVLYHPPEYNGPILFSFREKFFFDKKAATIRVDNGEWSNKIPLDVAGSMGAVTCKSKDTPYQIGVHNHLTYNSLTKMITFIPFYIASNKCYFEIDLQEQSRPGDPWITVLPNSCTPLWPKDDSDLMLIARVLGQCTPAFKYSEAQCTLLKLPGNKYGGINVDVQATEGGVYIIFNEFNPGDAPGLIINHTNLPIVYQEKDVKDNVVVKPLTKLLHAWSHPSGENSIVFDFGETINDKSKTKAETDLRRDQIGEMKISDGSTAYWVTFLDGLQRVLLFTKDVGIAKKLEGSGTIQKITQSVEVRIHGIGFSLINNAINTTILYMGIASSGVIWEQKKGAKHFKQMNIHETAELEEQYQQYLVDRSVNLVKKYYMDAKYEIDFKHMILKKNKEREIHRTFYPGVWFKMRTSPYQMQLHAKINKIQIDNQLNDYIFPVVLAPIPPPKSVATTTVLKPFIEVSVVQWVVPNSTVKQYKYATMLIQEFHFKVDLIFLTALADMFASKVDDVQAAKLFNMNVESIEKPLSDLVETHSAQEQKNFYDNLHLGPIKIHVSFSMAGSDTTALPGILSTLVQGVGVTLTDVNDVVFRLAFFEREYQFFTQQQLTSEITTHYTGQALKQLYVLVLGLDVLGNPYGLVVGLKKGVEDLFYEPFQGAIQGPGEFAQGLALGVKSLFGHTVGGAAGAVSKITGAMGKGLAALTFDEEYQKKRRLHMNKKPQTFSEGIARSGKSLVMGFVDGVSGVVTKPVAGAREEGVEGFFKGVGKGVIGFVAQPTAGVVDFASGSFGAVRRAAEGQHDTMRLRAPRYIHQDNVVRPYCRAEAEGNRVFREIEKGKYAATDVFIHCEELVPKHEYFVVSNHRIIHATKNDLFGTYTVQWKYRLENIDVFTPTDKGLEIRLKKQNKKVMGMFSTNEVVRKQITIKDSKRRDHLIEILESQHKKV
ncbi:vacuolar protein sorting-associated protein 13 [Bactrocera tryoni]|uniref:vacuolar protein sorting-associated protein 13 n=1 Tax=Bactrocera tryoni TaxID=59916 RepID=UPI001A9609EB|nr:vacuolar protein sorting-associated protein 13 [Bactrocera tryoni]XP_039957881.1 vacuolar protein sorting-associated protein 13 [Bactrocera tryoni]